MEPDIHAGVDDLFGEVVRARGVSGEMRVPEGVRNDLIARGHTLRVFGPWSQGSEGGIVVDTKTGVLSAGADPRVEAYAWAW
jgi:gamma-glutamyltranspeptidase/glutathione hydrolase